MSKSKTTKKAPKAKAASATKATPGFQIKKDANGRFWCVPKDGSAERGPFTKMGDAKAAANGAPANGAPAKEKATKTKAAKQAKPAKEKKEKKLSALSAAAQVLAGSKEPMNAQQMIEAMTAKKLWTSPGGKTPHATLYAAIIREISAKGKEARFVKTDRGQFTAKA